MGKLIDEIGNKYGLLTVIARSEEHKKKTSRAYWVCQCECGNICNVSSKLLLNGHTKSCGCLQKDRAREATLRSLVGQRFGKLVALKQVENNPQIIWWFGDYLLSLQRRRITGNLRKTRERIGNAVGMLHAFRALQLGSSHAQGSSFKTCLQYYLTLCRFYCNRRSVKDVITKNM